jgi:hypothetical protein
MYEQQAHKSQLPIGLQRDMQKFDKKKQLRFEAYYLEQESQTIMFDVPNNMMTASMLRKEAAEFQELMDG